MVSTRRLRSLNNIHFISTARHCIRSPGCTDDFNTYCLPSRSWLVQRAGGETVTVQPAVRKRYKSERRKLVPGSAWRVRKSFREELLKAKVELTRESDEREIQMASCAKDKRWGKSRASGKTSSNSILVENKLNEVR